MKTLAALLAALAVFTASGAVAKPTPAKTLIAFFSWSGTTRDIAREIARKTGADVFEIELVKPYSTDYNTVLKEAQRDQRAAVRPEIKNKVADMDKYDTILLGYPNWWASIPMPIATFLESYDFSGKVISPFCSNGGGRLGQSVSAITKLVPAATVQNPLSIYYSGGDTLGRDLDAWLKKSGF